MSNIIPNTILDFWFSDLAKPLHFQKDPDFDKKIYNSFLSVYQEASQKDLNQNNLTHWQDTAEGMLALILILDQFPRNMFRNTSRSFATDEQACKLAQKAIHNCYDNTLTKEQCTFLYMPFMHSENLQDQELSVKLYTQLALKKSLEFALAHYKIILRFGRFPHRNVILNRVSTPEETEFLKDPNSSF